MHFALVAGRVPYRLKRKVAREWHVSTCVPFRLILFDTDEHISYIECITQLTPNKAFTPHHLLALFPFHLQPKTWGRSRTKILGATNQIPGGAGGGKSNVLTGKIDPFPYRSAGGGGDFLWSKRINPE